MASRKLTDLSEPVMNGAIAMLAACNRAGYDVLIYCTLRSLQEQDELFSRGRDNAGRVINASRVVTYARGLQSLHNPDLNGKAWAFDAVLMIGGKLLWNDKAALLVMGRCGEAAGLEWAGRWTGKLRESVHFQIKPKSEYLHA